MAKREELLAIIGRPGQPSPVEEALLIAEANAIRSTYAQEINRLRVLRMKGGLTPSEREEVGTLRHAIAVDIKFAANMERKAGRPVEAVR
jgi:hypothetical protein